MCNIRRYGESVFVIFLKFYLRIDKIKNYQKFTLFKFPFYTHHLLGNRIKFYF
jgi:hypothetical protein